MRRSQELRDQYGQDLRPRKVSFAQSPLCLCNHKKSMKNGYRKGGCLFYLGLLPHPWIRKGGQAEQRISSGNSSEHGFAKAEAIIRLQAKPTEERLTLHSAHKFLLHANPLWTPLPPLPGLFPQNKFTSLHTVCDVSAPERRTQELCLQWEPELQRRLGSPHQYSR